MTLLFHLPCSFSLNKEYEKVMSSFFWQKVIQLARLPILKPNAYFAIIFSMIIYAYDGPKAVDSGTKNIFWYRQKYLGTKNESVTMNIMTNKNIGHVHLTSDHWMFCTDR